MILALVLLPAVAAVAAFLIRGQAARRALLVATAAFHAALVCWLWIDPSRFPPLGDWLAVDGLGMLFLGIASLLFLAASTYAVGFLRAESGSTRADPEEGFLFDNIPEALFTACLVLLGLAIGMILLAAQVFRRPPADLAVAGFANADLAPLTR